MTVQNDTTVADVSKVYSAGMRSSMYSGTGSRMYAVNGISSDAHRFDSHSLSLSQDVLCCRYRGRTGRQ